MTDCRKESPTRKRARIVQTPDKSPPVLLKTNINKELDDLNPIKFDPFPIDEEEINIEVVEEGENSDSFPQLSCHTRHDPSVQDFLEKVIDERSALQYTFQLNLLPDPQVYAAKFAKVLKEKTGRTSRSGMYFSVGFCGRTLRSGLICPGIMKGPKTIGNRNFYQCAGPCRVRSTVKNGLAALGAEETSESKGKTFFLVHTADTNIPFRFVFKLMWSFVYAKSFPETRDFCTDDQGIFTFSDPTLIDRFNVFRGILSAAFKNAPKIGGPEETVYIDIAFLPCGYRDTSSEDRLLIRHVKLGCTDKDHCQTGPWIIGILGQKYNGEPELRCFTTDSLDAGLIGTFLNQNIAHDTEIVCMDEKLRLIVQEQCHFSGNVQYSASDQSESSISSVYGTVRRTVTRVQFEEWMAFYWWRSMHKNALFTNFCAEIASQFPI